MSVKDKKGASVVVTKERQIPKDYIMKQKGNVIPSKIITFGDLEEMINSAVTSHNNIPVYARKTNWYCTVVDNTITTNVPVGIWKQHIDADVFKANVKVIGSDFVITNW